MGRPKASLVLAGESLLARSLRTMESCVCELIVSAARSQSLPAIASAFKRVDDTSLDQGPLPALGGALAAVEGMGCEAAVVLAVDMPLVSAEIINFMLKSLRNEDEAVVPLAGGYPQSLCAVYRTCVWRTIAEMPSSERSMRQLLARLPHRVLEEREFGWLDDPASCFRSINTPEEYEQVRLRIEMNSDQT